jgi:hypothetical protein
MHHSESLGLMVLAGLRIQLRRFSLFMPEYRTWAAHHSRLMFLMRLQDFVITRQHSLRLRGITVS